MSAPPQSKIDVCNIALDYVGQAPISSIDPPVTLTETIVARHYDYSRQTVLRKGVWNFAWTPVNITRIGTPLFGYQDQYQFPSDFIRFVGLASTSGLAVVPGNPQPLPLPGAMPSKFEIQGRTLLINMNGAASVPVIYIADITDPTLWDALFCNLVSLTLALKIAYPITKKRDVVEQINRLLSLEWGEALSIDGQEVPPVRVQVSQAVQARRVGIYGNASVAPPWTDIP